MTKMTMPSYNFCMLVGYAEQIPLCKDLGNGRKCAEFTILIPGEKGSHKIFSMDSLAEDVARDVKPADMVICYGRATTEKSSGRVCLQIIRIENYGKDIDLQHMLPLDIIKSYTINVPEAGYHRIRG